MVVAATSAFAVAPANSSYMLSTLVFAGVSNFFIFKKFPVFHNRETFLKHKL